MCLNKRILETNYVIHKRKIEYISPDDVPEENVSPNLKRMKVQTNKVFH